jgi:hypothetical protein
MPFLAKRSSDQLVRAGEAIVTSPPALANPKTVSKRSPRTCVGEQGAANAGSSALEVAESGADDGFASGAHVPRQISSRRADVVVDLERFQTAQTWDRGQSPTAGLTVGHRPMGASPHCGSCYCFWSSSVNGTPTFGCRDLSWVDVSAPERWTRNPREAVRTAITAGCAASRKTRSVTPRRSHALESAAGFVSVALRITAWSWFAAIRRSGRRACRWSRES